VQYRFTRELASFPSKEFYEDRLQTAISNSAEVLDVLGSSEFPWPRANGVIVPTVFIQCGDEESMGGASKSNEGQAKVVQDVISLLVAGENEASKNLKITVLSPYSKQVLHLKNSLRPPTPCHTIDSFQGRESDIIIFSTVRCNAAGDIGFVEDRRRLNVMWTRAKLAVIIVGDHRTMIETSELWKRAIEACTEVKLVSENEDQ